MTRRAVTRLAGNLSSLPRHRMAPVMAPTPPHAHCALT